MLTLKKEIGVVYKWRHAYEGFCDLSAKLGSLCTKNCDDWGGVV